MSGSLPGGLVGGLLRRALAPRRRSTTLVGVGGGLRARRVMRAVRTGTSRLACSTLGAAVAVTGGARAALAVAFWVIAWRSARRETDYFSGIRPPAQCGLND